jgi:hypothetical protein
VNGTPHLLPRQRALRLLLCAMVLLLGTRRPPSRQRRSCASTAPAPPAHRCVPDRHRRRAFVTRPSSAVTAGRPGPSAPRSRHPATDRRA